MATYKAAVARYEKINAYLDWNFLLAAKELGSLYAKDSKKGNEAEQIFSGILVHFDKIGALEKAERLTTMNSLARLLYKRNKINEAEILWVKSLANHEKLHALDDGDALKILWTLTVIYKSQKRWKAMEDCISRAIGVLKRTGAVDMFSFLHVCKDLTMTLENPGDLTKALGTIQVTEELYQRFYGPRRQATRDAVTILARVRKKKEKSEKRGWF